MRRDQACQVLRESQRGSVWDKDGLMPVGQEVRRIHDKEEKEGWDVSLPHQKWPTRASAKSHASEI